MHITLARRIALLVKLGQYIIQNKEALKKIKEKAFEQNGWFLPQFIDLAMHNIATQFLSAGALQDWLEAYPLINSEKRHIKKVGIVMAGNIPLAGFHDFLCVFVSGHIAVIKASSKDDTLIKHLTEKLTEWEPALTPYILYTEMLKKCDAYIATGSNNSAGYFDYYFGKYPHIIRRNRSSAAILSGNETPKALSALADDVHLYFGMGCRNVTQLFLPRHYDVKLLIEAFKKYEWFSAIHKYKNNYDYNLALLVLNRQQYMSTGALLLVEDAGLFAPLSRLHYQFYDDDAKLVAEQLEKNESLQCIVGKDHVPFGRAQAPQLTQYADGIDTLQFLLSLC